MTKKRATMCGAVATACLLLASGSAARAQDRQDVLVQPPLLPAPERGSVAGALSRLAVAPSDQARGTFALPASITSLPTPAQHHALAQAAFPRYFERAAQLHASFEHSPAHHRRLRELHQIAEAFYKAVLLCSPPTCPRPTTSPSSAAFAPGPARTSARSFHRMPPTVRASPPSFTPRTPMRAIASRSTSRVEI